MALPLRGVSLGNPDTTVSIALDRGAQRPDMLRRYAVALWVRCAELGIRADAAFALLKVDVSTMNACVLRLRHDLKVFWTVVAAIAVAMMNDFIWTEIAANLALRYQAMLGNIAVLLCVRMIWSLDIHVPLAAIGVTRRAVSKRAGALHGFSVASTRTESIRAVCEPLGTKLRTALLANEDVRRLLRLADLRNIGALARTILLRSDVLRLDRKRLATLVALEHRSRGDLRSTLGDAHARTRTVSGAISVARLDVERLAALETRLLNWSRLRGHSADLQLGRWGVVPAAGDTARRLLHAPIIPQFRAIRAAGGAS